MDIKTKYNIDDDVYFLKERTGSQHKGELLIVKGSISHIHTTTLHLKRTDITYSIGNIEINEENIDKNPKNLIDKLYDKLSDLDENIRIKLTEDHR